MSGDVFTGEEEERIRELIREEISSVSEGQRQEQWEQEVRRVLFQMRQACENTFDRGVGADTDQLSRQLEHQADQLEQLIDAADSTDDEFVAELEQIHDQAREAQSAGQFGPKQAAGPGKKLKKDVQDLLEKID